MDSIFNKSKVNLYAKIQRNLSLLKPNSTEEEIDSIFQQIPPSFYEEKENLIMICQFLGMIGRYRRQMGRITIQLFEKIMKYIKKNLSDDPSLFWNIFGSCSYFKYWMYKEGLIDVNQILMSSQSEETSLSAEYFLPEIIENDPELFHSEIKKKFPCFSSENSYSSEKVKQLKILREKHLKWLKESGDYHDESYREIEKDPIRLAIKIDDISTFQSILSHSNLSINSTISESMIEHFLRTKIEMHLIDYAANYCAFNIFNFLILNGAKIEIGILNFIIHSDNYYMIHVVESKINQIFREHAIYFAIIGWNYEFIKYIIDNYGYTFLENEEESESDNENNDQEENANQEEDKNQDENENKNQDENENQEEDLSILKIIDNTIYCYNMYFFKSILLPFLRKNPNIFENNFQIISASSLTDLSFYFTEQLINYSKKDEINPFLSKSINSLLIIAIDNNNTRAFEKLIDFQYVDPNSLFFYSCVNFANLKIIEILSHRHDFDCNYKHPLFNISILQVSMIKGNSYVLKFLFRNFPDIKLDDLCDEILYCIKLDHLLTLKILIEHMLNKYDDAKFQETIDDYIKKFPKSKRNETFAVKLLEIIDEIKKNKL